MLGWVLLEKVKRSDFGVVVRLLAGCLVLLRLLVVRNVVRVVLVGVLSLR